MENNANQSLRNRGSYEYKEENRQKLLHKMSNSKRNL